MNRDPYARTAARLARDLAPKAAARERALRDARDLVRASSLWIRALHRDPKAEPPADFEPLKQRLRRLTQDHPFLEHHGAVEQGFQEYAEACLFAATVRGQAPPPASRLDIPAGAYLLGMADLVGELRRSFQSALLAANVRLAHARFDSMEKVYEALTSIDVPEPLVPLRPKLDAARGILERARGELVTAKQSRDLEKKVDEVGRLLDEAERPTKPRAPRKSDEDLDLDAAWSKS